MCEAPIGIENVHFSFRKTFSERQMKNDYFKRSIGGQRPRHHVKNIFNFESELNSRNYSNLPEKVNQKVNTEEDKNEVTYLTTSSEEYTHQRDFLKHNACKTFKSEGEMIFHLHLLNLRMKSTISHQNSLPRTHIKFRNFSISFVK